MFNRVESAIKLTALFLILGLCAWLRVQYSTISHLRAENRSQAQTIKSQSAVISQLKFEAEENQRVTLELSKQEVESRSQVYEVIKSISKQERNGDAYLGNAPRAVIDFLRQE